MLHYVLRQNKTKSRFFKVHSKDISARKEGLSQQIIVLITIFSVLIVDQTVKFVVKTNMTLGEQIRVTDWFYILFVENNGMAFGMEIVGKLTLSLFRIAAVTLFCIYLYKILDRGFPKGYIICVSFIIAGATGNIIDSVFYGQIFTASGYGIDDLAHLTTFGQGYAPVFYGKVVDMFYFPLWTWPEWLPLLGGKIFFSPVFNVADSSISCGIVVLMLFYSKYMNIKTISQDSKNDMGHPE